MAYWPLDIEFPTHARLGLAIFDRRYNFYRQHTTSILYEAGDASAAKLIGIADNTDILRFVPSLGAKPLLIIPEIPLICPSKTHLRFVTPLPLHIEFSLGNRLTIKQIDDIHPPDTAKALYGPVDSGTICSSLKTTIAPTLEELVDTSTSTTPLETLSDNKYHFNIVENTSPRREDVDEQTDGNRIIKRNLVAYATFDVYNDTLDALEIAKIMTPITQLHLHQTPNYLLTNTIDMRLISKTEAELTYGPCPDPHATPIKPGSIDTTIEKRPHIFSYTYRNKTGLDFGF